MLPRITAAGCAGSARSQPRWNAPSSTGASTTGHSAIPPIASVPPCPATIWMACVRPSSIRRRAGCRPAGTHTSVARTPRVAPRSRAASDRWRPAPRPPAGRGPISHPDPSRHAAYRREFPVAAGLPRDQIRRCNEARTRPIRRRAARSSPRATGYAHDGRLRLALAPVILAHCQQALPVRREPQVGITQPGLISQTEPSIRWLNAICPSRAA